jgi:hypothetical protein
MNDELLKRITDNLDKIANNQAMFLNSHSTVQENVTKILIQLIEQNQRLEKLESLAHKPRPILLYFGLMLLAILISQIKIIN